MELRLRIIILLTCLGALIFFLDFIRKDKISLRFSLPWLFCIGVTALLAIFPGLIDLLSLILGIRSPMNALFFCAIVFLITILFSSYLSTNRNSARTVRLVQEVALLQYELQQRLPGKGSRHDR